MKAVILAGGSGERFWPLSTMDQPKQFLRLFDERSLIRVTFERLTKRLDPEDIMVVTSKMHEELTRTELPEIPVSNIIGEPSRMNTAPACVVGSMLAQNDEPVLTVPADHLIPDVDGFWDLIDTALHGLADHGGLFTFGISPTKPETGYGYIEAGDMLAGGIHKVISFREKPDDETAKGFLKSGRFFWNSGMFLWKPETLFQEMMKHCPEVMDPMKSIDPRIQEDLKGAYERVKRISVDYALMERSDEVHVVPTKIQWSDVGSWESIMDLEGNSEENERHSLAGSNNILIRSATDRKIAVVGLSNIIVVDTVDGLLILDKTSSQRVREASRHLS